MTQSLGDKFALTETLKYCLPVYFHLYRLAAYLDKVRRHYMRDRWANKYTKMNFFYFQNLSSICLNFPISIFISFLFHSAIVNTCIHFLLHQVKSEYKC